jgi:VCBS repeat-containing protein
MGAPNITGTTTGSVTENSGLIVTGNLDDSNPWYGNDAWSIISAPTYGIATINPTTGVWSYDLNDSNPVVHALDAGDTLTDTFTVRLSDTGGSDTQVVTITIHGAPCFTPGTLIDTPEGKRRVEEIVADDLVTTRDHGPRPVRWAGKRCVVAQGDLAPICIAAGVLGNTRELIVSPQHRILITGWLAELHCGAPEVLVAARHLVDGMRIRELPGGEVTYIHIMFDQHEVIYAEDLATESFFAAGALAGEMAATEKELGRIFDDLPELSQFPTVRPCASKAEAQILRHALCTGAMSAT